MAIKIRGLEALNIFCGGTAAAQEPTIEDDLNGMQPQQKSSSASSSSILDKYTVQEKVVPLLRAIKTKEPAVMMAALTVFKQVGKVADTDYLALEVLPTLWSFSLGPLLNLEQFQGFMTLIKSLSTKIETEQTRKLSELNSPTNGSARSGAASFGGMNGSSAANGMGVSDEATDFESLVTGRRQKQQEDLFDAGWDASATRPAVARTQSLQQKNEAPRFAWSTTPSPAVQSPIQTQPTGGITRTITPDNLGSFASLMPQTRAASGNTMPTMQPMQPQMGSFGQTSAMPTMQPMQPHRATGSMSAAVGSAPGASIDWSRPAGQAWNSGQSAANNSFSIASPPPGAGMTVQMPMRGSSASNNAAGQTQQMGAPKPRSGLDKYESLI